MALGGYYPLSIELTLKTTGNGTLRWWTCDIRSHNTFSVAIADIEHYHFRENKRGRKNSLAVSGHFCIVVCLDILHFGCSD
jgi:hypothetical protein